MQLRAIAGARYLAAETRYGIGGDWYDAVLLSGGRILLIVGDVAGYGLKAAITMGQMRRAARALAPTHGPAALLDALDPFADSTLEASLVTAAVVIIDPGQRTLRYCLAGHLSPLLREPDGTVTTLGEARGALLALGPGIVPSGWSPTVPAAFGAIHRRARGAARRDNRHRARQDRHGTQDHNCG
jgi:serine phosphatase RsbU (regulator of sigma subunit)